MKFRKEKQVFSEYLQSLVTINSCHFIFLICLLKYPKQSCYAKQICVSQLYRYALFELKGGLWAPHLNPAASNKLKMVLLLKAMKILAILLSPSQIYI